MKPGTIRTIAICLFRDRDRLLVFEGHDSVKGDQYYRPLGGGVEFGEATQDAVAREIREELGLEVTDLVLERVLENRFVVDGRQGHEIVFVYSGRFVDEHVYETPVLEGREDDGTPFRVEWRSLSAFDATHRLVPEELWEVVGQPGSLAGARRSQGERRETIR